MLIDKGLVPIYGLNNAQRMLYYREVNSIKNFFTSIILLSLLGLVLWALAPRILSVKLRPWIEDKISNEVGAFVILDSVTVKALYPFHIKLNKLDISRGNTTLKIPELDFRAVLNDQERESFLKLQWHSFVEVNDFALDFNFAAKRGKDFVKNNSVEDSILLLSLAQWLGWDSSLEIKMLNGASHILLEKKKLLRFDFKKIQLAAYKGSLVSGENMQMAANMLLQMDTPLWSSQMPVKMQSDNVRFSFKEMSSEDAFLIVPGIAGRMKFFFDFQRLKQDISVSFAVKDFAQVEIPQQLQSYGKWHGGVSGNFILSSDGRETSLQGHLVTNGLALDADYNSDDLKMKGEVKLNSNINFYTENEKLVLRPIQLSFDAASAEVELHDIVKKKKSVPFHSHLVARSKGDLLLIDDLNIQLSDLKLNIDGKMGFNEETESDLKIKIPRVSLKKAGQMSGIFKGGAWRGHLEGEANFKGDLNNDNTWSFLVKKLQLDKVSGFLNYKNAQSGFQFNGPFNIDGHSNLNYEKQQVSNMGLHLKADFSKSLVEMKSVVKKRNVPFKANVVATRDGDRLIFKKAAINYFTADINALGDITLTSQPKVNLHLDVQKFPLSHIKNFYEKTLWEFSGGMGFRGKLTGSYNSLDGLASSPLYLKGNSVLTVEKLYKNNFPANETIRAIFPNWKLLSNSNITVKALVKKMNLWGLDFEKGLFRGEISKGVLAGRINRFLLSEKSWLSVEDFKVNLMSDNPIYTIRGKYNQLPTKLVGNAFNLNNQTQLWGSVTGAYEAYLPSANTLESLKDLSIETKFSWDNGWLSTMQLDSLINEGTKAMKQVSFSRGKEKGYVFRAKGAVKVTNDLMELVDMDMQTAFNDRLVFSGSILKNLAVDLKGVSYLANPPIRPDIFEANMNNQSKLEMPFYVRGTLIKPKVVFNQGTEEQMLANYNKKKQ